MINLKDFDSKLLTTDTKSHKIIGIYYVGYITIKFISDYESITSVNPLYFTISEVNWFTEYRSTEEKRWK